MSGIDSEQGKQPISSVNGEASDANIQCSGKDVIGDQTTPVEGIKEAAEVDSAPTSCQSESEETKKDDEDKSKDSNSAEMTVNGVGQPVDDQEKSEASKNLGERSGEEGKPSESRGEPVGDEQVNGEGTEAEAGKEGESSAESKEAEPSTETIAIETNGEQGKSFGENQEREQSVEAVAMDTTCKEGDASAESKVSDPGHESVDAATNGVEVETSGDSKESEPVDAQANGEQAESKDSEASPEPVAMEISGEQVKVETSLSEKASAQTEAEEGTKAEVPEVTPGDHPEHQPSEESNITETDIDAVEKKRAVTIDSPGNVKEPDGTNVTTNQERSETVGDIEDDANRSTVEAEDTMSKPGSEAAAPDETVSYQTSIVGGVVHKVPINSYSPKGQRKPREGSPQTQPKKKNVIEALFGRRKKSKGGPESPPGTSPKGKGDKKEDQQELPEADTSGKGAEKEKLQEELESGSVIPGAIVDTAAKGTTEPAESGAGAEGERTCDTDNKQETEGKESAAVTEGNGEVEVQPTVAEQSEEGVKDETLQDVEEPKQAEIEPQDGKEDSAAVESMPQEKEEESTGEPKDEQPKKDDKQAQTDSPEGETSSQPTPKKKKSTGIFGGFFARRKSRKSKDAAVSPPEEKADDKVEEPQDADVSMQPTGEVAGTDQGVAPAADDANEGQQDPANPQKEAAEGAIIPAVDQTVESAKEEISDSDKVDVVAGREEADAAVTEKPEVPVKSTVPEDVQASSEEPLQSEETANATEKSTEKTVEPVPAEDSQPKAQQEEEHLIQPKIEVNNKATEEGEAAEDTTIPQVEEPKKEDDAVKETVEKTSPESEETQDEATELKERIGLRNGGSHSPTRRMQMRISYAETDGEGGKEVEVIGTPEKAPEVTNQKGKADHKVSCRALGEADNEGWLSKKGGMLFLSGWKRKWVVLKDGNLYYFRTAFDLEAGGVINMQGITVAEAPETKKKFCFKCEQPGAKPQVSVFMADSKEDMDKWLTVLTAASRGEVIQKPKQHQLAVMGEVTMRKKSGSTSAQRHSSILALGGRHDFLEDEEDRKATRRRSTPGSFSKVPKETEEEGKKAAGPSGTNQAPIDEKPADEPPNDQQQVASDAPSEPCGEQPALSAPSNEHLAPCDTPKEPASPDEAPEENTESGESKTTEKTVTVVVGEVFVGRDKVVVESTSSTVEVSTSETTTTTTTTTTDVEVTGETEKHDSATDSESPADKIDGAVMATTTESSVTVEETVKTSVEITETVETSTVVSEVQTEMQETAESDQKPEVKEGASEATLSEASEPLESEASETTPPKDSSSPPESPSNTKWYFSLDRKQTWSVAPEPEDEKASKRSKPRLSKSSDRTSIKSTSSDNESVKSLPGDDELMRLCRSIKKARLSIVGEPVPDGAERLRALSNVQGSDVAIMRLKTLERTLKDKEQHLSDLEELLNQPEINRQSIHEWKLRNSDLLEELFPKEDGEGHNEDEKAAEGGESETQKRDNLEEDGAEKGGKEESAEDVKEKLDKAEEEPSGSKEEGDGNVDEKQSASEEEVTGEQKLDKDEQQSTEKEEEKEKETENVLTEEGAVEQEESSAESAPPTETETEATDGKPEHEKDISPETSSEQKSSGESKEQQERRGDALDTQF